MGDLEKELKTAWDAYRDVLAKMGDKYFEREVLPFLAEHHYTFSSGYGWGWAIFDNTLKRKRLHDELPKHIVDILDMPVKGAPMTSFGDWMSDYPKEEEEE